MHRGLTVTLAVCGLFLPARASVAGPGEDAAAAFARGEAMLAKTDFAGALSAYRVAAQTDPSNKSYMQEYAMLRQVVRMRMDARTQRDTGKWLKMADALRAFYHDHTLYGEALPLDQERYRRSPSAESAAFLAQTQLALGMNPEAAEFLASRTTDGQSPRTRVLRALATARMGRSDEAAGLLSDKLPADHAEPQTWYELACASALTGDATAALAALTRSFELTPPSRLDLMKGRAGKCADLAALTGSPAFAAAMKTESKVKESKCSEGSDCSKCPSRAKCSTNKP